MPPRFLVVEIDGDGLPLVEWTRLHPGVQWDMILEPMKGQGIAAEAQAIVLVRGMDATASKLLETEVLERFYAPYTLTRRDIARGEWTGRITIHVRNMAGSPAMRAISAFGDRLGAPWSHIEGRMVHMRLRVPDGADAEVLAKQLSAELERCDANGQVSVESFSRHDFSVWEDLVQASIGLRS